MNQSKFPYLFETEGYITFFSAKFSSLHTGFTKINFEREVTLVEEPTDLSKPNPVLSKKYF
jgi:hypothetical protein